MRTHRVHHRLAALLAGLLIWTTASHAGATEAVMLSLNDGKNVSGDLVKADKEKVIVKVGEGDQAKEVAYPWEAVRKVSNGLTRDKIMQQWSKDNPDLVCADCKGEGKNVCPKCNGKGFLPDAPKVACTKCLQTGFIKCTHYQCALGKVPCDGPCLKPNEGNWSKGKDGLLWRRFVYQGGYAEWSEKHYGEVVQMKEGKPVNMGKCEKCKGTLKMNCPLCKGGAKIECPACKGSKSMVPDCAECKDGKVVCPTCRGNGEKQAAKSGEAKTDEAKK